MTDLTWAATWLTVGFICLVYTWWRDIRGSNRQR